MVHNWILNSAIGKSQAEHPGRSRNPHTPGTYISPTEMMYWDVDGPEMQALKEHILALHNIGLDIDPFLGCETNWLVNVFNQRVRKEKEIQEARANSLAGIICGAINQAIKRFIDGDYSEWTCDVTPDEEE